MALDFGLLNTNAPAQIAGAYGRGQQEVQANLLAEQQLQHVQNQNALSKYQIDAARMQNEQQNALNTKYAGGGFDPMSNDTHLRELYGMGAPGRAQAGEILKYRADQRKAEESAVGTAIKRHGVYQKSMGALATEADLTKDTVSATLDKLVANGIFSQDARDTIVQNLPDDPAALRASVMQDAKANLTGKDQLTAFLPELMVAGGNLVNKNPLAPGGAGAVVAPVAPTAFETARIPMLQQTANAATTSANAAAANAATARQREARLAQGPVSTSLTPEQNDALFGENGAVAMGKINPNKINSRNAKMWAEAFTRNPNADPVKVAQDVAAADKAIKDFGTGPQSTKVTAFNTAIDHLDTLAKLGEAMQNGDVKVANLLANKLGAQAGQPMATMFNQASRIVGGEISKAIVPGVGTQKERAEAAEAFNSAMSPAQLKGADMVAKRLLGGQLASLEQQYRRTTKRNDFAEQLLSPAARDAYQLTRPTETVAPITTNPHANKTDAQIRKELGLPP